MAAPEKRVMNALRVSDTSIEVCGLSIWDKDTNKNEYFFTFSLFHLLKEQILKKYFTF